MIIGNLQNSSRIESLHSSFASLFSYVKSHNFLQLPLGRTNVLGDDLFILNLEVDGADAQTQPLEMHRLYIDVHIVLEGKEKIGWKAIEDLSGLSKEYDAAGDCALSSDRPTTWIDLLPGQFCIVFPEDPHAPAVGEGKIRKLIAKVAL
ncbi:MAG: YhcH/YjgK/YiaL family protein [Bacteroides sp.]|nr:YhcH/YjgK/YiaL family protein [Bacteroides sp.]